MYFTHFIGVMEQNEVLLHSLATVNSTLGILSSLLLEGRRKIHDDDDIELFFLLEEERKRKERCTNYTKIVANMSDSSFKSNFRLSRTTLEVLLQLTGPTYAKESRSTGRPRCPLRRTMLLGLWYFANVETFKQVGERFKTSRGEAYAILHHFMKLMMAHLRRIIYWPKGAEARKTVNCFNRLRGTKSFPNVFGCIDGCHIRILAPKTQAESYCNRKKYPSVILQAVCDADMCFTNIFCGWPGSSNDARVFRNSDIGKALLDGGNPSIILPPETHLLGDGAYPLLETLLTPFKDVEQLTPGQKFFNNRLSLTRVVIEQAFGLLLGRFQRLKFLEVKKVEYVSQYVGVACMLHNICMRQQDFFTDLEEVEEMGEDGEDLEFVQQSAGVEKRERLSLQIFNTSRQHSEGDTSN